MSSKSKTKKTAKKRAQRATSNVFAMFEQSQIQEFKEAFNMIDQNRDGFIDADDLKDMFASLGKDVKDDYVEDMLSEASGAINFTMFSPNNVKNIVKLMSPLASLSISST